GTWCRPAAGRSCGAGRASTGCGTRRPGRWRNWPGRCGSGGRPVGSRSAAGTGPVTVTVAGAVAEPRLVELALLDLHRRVPRIAEIERRVDGPFRRPDPPAVRPDLDPPQPPPV